MQGQRQGALWGLGPAGQRGHQLGAHQPGRPAAAPCGPANTSRGAHNFNHTQGSADLWGFVAIGMQLNPAPQPGQVVRVFAGIVRDLGVPIEFATVEFVRYTVRPGSRSLAHLRLPPSLAPTLLAARCRLAAVHPGITLDLYRKRDELLYVREARDQRAPQRQTASAPAAGRADAATTWIRAPFNVQPGPSGTRGNGGGSGSIGDPYDSGPWGERAFMALAPGSTAAGGNSSDGSGTIPSSQASGGSSGGGDSSDGSSNAIGSSQGSSGSADETGGVGGREGAVGDGLAGEGMAGTGVAGTGITGQEGAGQLGFGDMGWLGKPRMGEWGGRGSLPLLLMRSSCLLDGAGLSALWISGRGTGLTRLALASRCSTVCVLQGTAQRQMSGSRLPG